MKKTKQQVIYSRACPLCRLQTSPWAGMTCMAQSGDRLPPRLNGGNVWDGSRREERLDGSHLQRHHRTRWPGSHTWMEVDALRLATFLISSLFLPQSLTAWNEITTGALQLIDHDSRTKLTSDIFMETLIWRVLSEQQSVGFGSDDSRSSKQK